MHTAKHIVFLAGLVIMIYGLWLIWIPAAWIVAGASLVLVSFLLDQTSRR